MRIEVEITETDLYGDYDNFVEGVSALCTRCGHEVESFGTTERSYKRCLALMHEQCPNKENNFYVANSGVHYE